MPDETWRPVWSSAVPMTEDDMNELTRVKVERFEHTGGDVYLEIIPARELSAIFIPWSEVPALITALQTLVEDPADA